jgi:hypothetical protein
MEKNNKTLLFVLGAAAALVLAGCAVSGPAKTGDSAPSTLPQESTPTGIPTIDADQPAAVETATFGLG